MEFRRGSLLLGSAALVLMCLAICICCSQPEAVNTNAPSNSEAAIPDGVRLSGKWQGVVWGTLENPQAGRPTNVSAEELISMPDEVSIGEDNPVKFTHMQWGDCLLRFDLKGQARVLLMGLYDLVELASEEEAATPAGEWTNYEVRFIAPRWRDGALASAPQLQIDIAGERVRELTALPFNETAPPEGQVNEIGEQFGPLRIEAAGNQSASLREIWVGPLELARDTSQIQWREMFDGKTLNGWSVNGGDARYRIENGEVIGTTVPNSENSFLISDEDYENFEFSVEVHGSVEFNAGLQFRSHATGGRGRRNRTFGYQCEIDPSDRRWTAGIYDEARRGWLQSLPYSPELRMPIEKDRWNEFRILADGSVIKTYLNGMPIAHIYDAMTKRGYFGLQVHAVEEGDPPMEIRWRNVKIRELD